MIENKRIFITGGAGFIATKLIGELADKNEIVVYDNFTRNTLVTTPLDKHANVRKVAGDVLDFELLKKEMAGADIVVHAAAIAGIDSTSRNPVRTMRVNMIGTANVFEAATELKNLERIVDFSTSEVFGSQAFKVDEGMQTITGAVGQARWIYAVSKLAGEHLAFAYFKEFGMPTTTVRPFNVYGPGQTGEGAMSIFIRKAINNENIPIFGDGGQIRAWCFVDDMVEGVLKAMENENAIGESFNIGNSRAVTTIHALAEAVIRITRSKSAIVFRDALSADIDLRIPKVDKAKRLIGFQAKTDLAEGIIETARWIRQNEQTLPPLSSIFASQ